MVQVTNAIQAIQILDRIEYSLDGFPKRYPEAGEFYAAVEFLKNAHKFYEIKQTPIMTKPAKMHGTVYPAKETGMFAEFGKTEDGKVTLRITGRYGNYKDVDITFTEGDTAVYNSYNFDYLGTITNITEKTVTIQPQYGERTRRLDLALFANRNHDFSLERSNRRRMEWSD